MRLSFEFFPPQTPAGIEHLERSCQELAALQPDYFSVTFATGGQSAQNTYNSVCKVQKLTGADVRPHLSCLDPDRVRALLRQYQEIAVKGLVLLRGEADADGELSSAEDLVRLVRSELGESVEVAVAAYPEVHPQALSAAEDFESFRRKVEAGANFAITQLFYNPDAYSDFLERCARAGLDVDVIVGVMPITNTQRLLSICKRSGVELPRWMCDRMDEFGDDEMALQSWGVDLVASLCEQLAQRGAPGFHFYAMNRSQPALQLAQGVRQ